MNKILILVEKEFISFSKYNRNISEENLNNTNIINVKNLKFAEDYILENLDLVSTFLNLIFIKFKLSSVVIKNLEIAEVVLKMLEKIENVKSINFIEDKELSYVVSNLLYQNKNLESVECYNLPEIMFYRFEKNRIKTRSKILSSSNFLKNNNINTYSELYNKDKIIIDEYLSFEDIDDMVYFFNTNVNLKKITFKRYSNQNLITILKLLKKNNVKNVNVIIYENNFTTQELLNDVKTFDKLNREYNVIIKIKYSKEYKEKNRVKELNLILFRNIIISCTLICIMVFILYKLLEKKDTENLKDNIEKIESQIEEKIESQTEEVMSPNELISEDQVKEVSAYYKNYSKVYTELLELNNDTVGWLTVNNTKINYPVVQSNDNDYYLNHAYDKSNNLGGWVFVDYRNDMDLISKNTIIYGHNISNSNLIFSTLKNVLDSNWYNNENNLNINFSIKDKEYTWKVFSIYTIEVTSDYLYTEFNTENDYLNFLQKLKDRSINNFNEELTSEDKILTLSTCYKDDKHRVVVHAKLIK